MDNQSINIIIVDDEIGNIETLELLFTKYFPQVNILSSFTNSQKALAFILKNPLPIDAIYTDIKMPKMDGLEFVSLAKNYCDRFVFTTAFPEYAIQAIKLGAFDYIVKPIAIEELRQSIDNIMAFKVTNEVTTKMPIHLKKGIEFIEVNAIVRVNAQGNYTLFEFTDRPSSLVTRQLNQFEDQFLANPSFLKVNRSQIINLHHIKSLTRGRIHKIQMHDGTEINVGNTYKHKVFSTLKDNNIV